MTTWDVIIVGAGSAGAALASRLSDESNHRVLLSDSRDAVRMRIATRELFAVLAHGGVRAITDTLKFDNLGTTPDDLCGDRALDAWLKTVVSDYVHPCGSCKMGSLDDPAAVVDPGCRFIGVQNLSVVDASIMPFIPRANTHLTSVMIGERAASLLLA